jgi:thioredoxin reductase
VKEARNRGVLISSGLFQKINEKGVIWDDDTTESFDVIVWCTGFGFATSFLKELVEMDERGIVKTVESKVQAIDGLWLVGYGGWTGFASATLIGINRNVKLAVQEVEDYLLNSLKN